MKIKKREVVKIEHYAYCPYCDHEVKGNAANQVEYNLKKHMKKCSKKEVKQK